MLSCNGNTAVQIFNSEILYCESKFGGLIFLLETFPQNFILKNCSLMNNKGFFNLIEISSGSIILVDVYLKDNFNNILSLTDSECNIESIKINEHECENQQSGCFLSAFAYSKINMTYIYLNNLSSKNSFGNIFLENSMLYLSSSAFDTMLTTKEKGSCIFLTNSFIEIKKSTFESFYSNCIYSEKSKTFIDESFFSPKNTAKSQFAFINLFYFEIIYIEDPNICEISFSKILSGNQNFSGRALRMLSTKKFFSLKENKILNNSFIFNQAEYEGGSIFLNDINILLFKNFFAKNKAQFGGAIYILNTGN